MEQHVDVVIRTAGRPERRNSLLRAICSVLDQIDVAARPLLMLAGEHSSIATDLARQTGVQVHIVWRARVAGATPSASEDVSADVGQHVTQRLTR